MKDRRRLSEHFILAMRLTDIRKARKLTQSEAAKRLRRPQSYISTCETAKRTLDVVDLVDFATTYRVRLVDLLWDFLDPETIQLLTEAASQHARDKYDGAKRS